MLFNDANKKRNGLFYLLIGLMAVFYLFNIHGGHNWGSDFSMYIMHADNLIHGRPYAQTSYLYNPDMAVVGPKAYPPVFPVLLAPVLAVWGLNYKALKLVGVICLVIFLILFNQKILPKNLAGLLRVAVLLLMGFYPVFFYLTDCVLSDLPFLLFCVIALIRIDDHLNMPDRNKNHWAQILLTGLLIYLAFGIRSAGLVFIPVILVFDFLKNRRISVPAIAIVLVVVALIAVQGLLIPQTGSYFDQFPDSISGWVEALTHNVTYYFRQFYRIFPFDNDIVQGLVALVFNAFFLIGFINRVRRRISLFEVFFVGYLAFIVLWPTTSWLRFMIPVLPLYFLYFIEGFEWSLHRLAKPAHWQTTFSLALICAVMAYSIMVYLSGDQRAQNDMDKVETQELFAFVRTQLSSSDIVGFYKPRALALYTDQTAASLAIPYPDGDVLDQMESLGITVIIARTDITSDNQPAWMQWIEDNPDHLDMLFENGEFQVYRVTY